MILLAVILTAAATVALFLAGYLVGTRAGYGARVALREESDAAAARIVELETKLAAQPAPQLDLVKNELQATIAPLLAIGQRELQRDLRDVAAAREQESESFREQLQRDLMKSMSTLVAQRGDGSTEVRKVMSDLLGPMLERERMGRELSMIAVGGGGLGELPKVVDAITKKGGFASVVLSDESGLPLAASEAAADVDSLAGAAAFFLTLADRASHNGHPRPISCVILDDTNRMTLHRIFRVASSRFTLSAISRGAALAPGALDGALSPLERVLDPRRDYSRAG